MALREDMVTVVAPTFDEEEAIGLVIDEVRATGLESVLRVLGKVGFLSFAKTFVIDGNIPFGDRGEV